MMGWGIKRAFPKDELILTDRDTLDITAPGRVEKPDIIFHLAAETDHHHAELNPSNTYMINHTGTMNIVELARKWDIPIVYVGTCGMYAGEKMSYTETDIPSPLNHYGRSKYYGELAIKSYEKHYIVRCGWAFGGGDIIDKKFVKLIFQQRNQKFIFAIRDVFGSPTYTYDYAKHLHHILETEYGTYNCGGDGIASRYDVAKELINIIGSKAEVVPMSYSEYHARFGLKVPYTKCEVLDNSKIYSLGIPKMRHWKDALKEYAEENLISH
jgi:dTDP-4-dehydrorhamnose reductase